MSNNVWKYFKKGDVIRQEEVWGKKLLEISSFSGNWYCPIICAYFLGKPKSVSNMCNIDVRQAKLITSPHRPFKKLERNSLKKLVSKGNVEAKREFLMRVNTKSL